MTGASQFDIQTEADALRYVTGSMTPEEEQSFEVAMLERPEIAAHVWTTQQMHAGLGELSQRGELNRSAKKGVAPPWFALAAGIAAVAVVAGTLSYFRGTHGTLPVLSATLAQLEPGISGVRIASAIMLTHMRGRPETAPVSLSQHQGAVRIQILPGGPEGSGTYEVNLQRVEREKPIFVAKAYGLAPDSLGAVSVYIEPSRLTPGDYELLLKGHGTVERYPLRMVTTP